MILGLIHRLIRFIGCVDFEVQRLRGAEIALGRLPFHGEAALSIRQQVPALLELLLSDPVPPLLGLGTVWKSYCEKRVFHKSIRLERPR